MLAREDYKTCLLHIATWHGLFSMGSVQVARLWNSLSTQVWPWSGEERFETRAGVTGKRYNNSWRG